MFLKFDWVIVSCGLFFGEFWKRWRLRGDVRGKTFGTEEYSLKWIWFVSGENFFGVRVSKLS